MAELKSIGPGSVFKVFGFMYAVIGLIIGALISLASVVGMGAMGGSEAGGAGMLFGIGAIILLPIIYGLAGAIGGAIGALVYNVCAKVTGGIELEM